jgi:TldD protein
VRVIHSGVWGFASSPIVTEDELRRITRLAAEIAKASAIAKKADVKLALVPAHAMLTIHEIVAHATEVDRIAGYEANYAGTSFVKSDINKLTYGSKHFNVTSSKNDKGIGSVASTMTA